MRKFSGVHSYSLEPSSEFISVVDMVYLLFRFYISLKLNQFSFKIDDMLDRKLCEMIDLFYSIYKISGHEFSNSLDS